MNDQLLMQFPEEMRDEVRAHVEKTGESLEWLVKVFQRGYNTKLGATGKHPHGKMDADDEGELSVALGIDTENGVIRMVFGKPVAWLALPSGHARHLALLLTQHAAFLDNHKM